MEEEARDKLGRYRHSPRDYRVLFGYLDAKYEKKSTPNKDICTGIIYSLPIIGPISLLSKHGTIRSPVI